MNFIPFSVIHLTMIRGGDKRDRTADLLHAMQALSQLSYQLLIINLNAKHSPTSGDFTM